MGNSKKVSVMNNLLLLSLFATLLISPSLASTQNDNARAAFERKDAAALTAMAEAGDPIAQTLLGSMYRSGEGVTKDPVIAISWLRKAADQGVPNAQVALGNHYEKGIGTAQDYLAAVSWYRKAADQGVPIAQTSLGIMYAKGAGVEQNYDIAISWFRKAADQGYAPAQRALRMAEAEATKKIMNDPAFLAQYEQEFGDASFTYKGYKVTARKGVMPIVNSCLDLIIKSYNLSYKNKYGQLVNSKKLHSIHVAQQSQKSFRNGDPFKTQPYSITYTLNGENEVDLVYCESKNGIAFGLENSIS
jgi:TPR repeat protein